MWISQALAASAHLWRWAHVVSKEVQCYRKHGYGSTHYFEYAAKYQEKIWLVRLNVGYDFNGRFLNGVFKKIMPIAGDSSLRSERRATF